jgi:hypothetical protein
VLAFYLYKECNFGGLEGAKILDENELLSLQVGQILLKKLTVNADEGSK